jgi:uroporphyrinogen-III synthase
LVEAFREAGDAQDQRIFFPASSRAREEIPTGLTELGAQVDRTTAYRMVRVPVDDDACRAAYEEGTLGVVTFASPSAMEGLRAGVGEDLFRLLADEVPAAAMGPTTAAALDGAGWRRISVATEPTLDGLADAVEAAILLDPSERPDQSG